MSCLTDQRLDLDALLAATTDPECGALVVFGGTVRVQNEGREVSHIEYSAYAPLADRTLAEIEAETCRKFALPHCRLVHRTGDLKVGELSVIAVVRAPHRGEAFDAARYAIEALKHRVAIWKNEHYTDGSSDYLDGHPLAGQTPPDV